MRNLVAMAAAIMLSPSLAAFCQSAAAVCNPQTVNCCTPQCVPPPKVIYRTKYVDKPAPPTQAPPPVFVQSPPVTINVPPTNLEPLVAPFTLIGRAKMNETRTLENLGDVDSNVRADMATRYAEARIKEMTAQATLTESQAGLNQVEAKFTETKRKSYVVLRIVDDLSGVAQGYLNATKINSTISALAAGGGGGSAVSSPTVTQNANPTITQTANPTMTGPTVNQTNSQIANPTMTASPIITGPTVTTTTNTSATANPVTKVSTPVSVKTGPVNVASSNSNSNSSDSQSSAKQSQGQQQDQSQSQSQSQQQTGGDNGEKGGSEKPAKPCPPKKGGH